MRFSDRITLINEYALEPDENGIQRTDKEARTVYGNIRSVTGEEIKTAELRGLKAVCRADIWGDEYSDEMLAIVNSQLLEVYRTYRTGEKMELYLGQKVGVTNG